MLSGALMGISLVLKYTGYLYCIAILFTLLILNKKIPDFKKTAAVYFISVVVSFLIFGSSWLYSIYKLYDNPLFPYLNNIFHSKYYDYIDMSRIDCLGIRPRNLFEIVFYPFLWSSTFLFGSYRMDWDPRYAINVISSIMIALHLIWTRKEEGLYLDIIKRDYLCFLLLFINISYYILVYITGIYRFIIPTSCLFGITALIACVLISKCFKSKDICKLLIFISLFIFVYINSFCTTERNFVMPVKNAKLFYNDEKYDIQDGSKVLLLNPITSYFTAGQNKNAQYLGFVIPKHIYKKYEDYLKKEEPISWFAHYMFSDYLENLIKETVTKSENKIYIIYSDSSYFEDVYKEALDFYSNGRRKMENCRKISYKGLVYFNYAEANLCEYNMI